MGTLFRTSGAGFPACLICSLILFTSLISKAQDKPLFKRPTRYSLTVQAGLIRTDGFEYGYSNNNIGKYIIEGGGRGEIGLHAGLIGRRDFKRWFCQVETIYNQDVQGYRIYNTAPDPFPYGFTFSSAIYEYQRLEIPLAVGLKLKPWLRASAGIVPAFYFYKSYPKDKRPDYQIFEDIQQSLRHRVIGYRLGAQADWKRLYLGLFYGSNFTSISNSINHRQTRYPFRQGYYQLSLSIGYTFVSF